MGAKPQPCYNRIRAINDRVIMRLQCINIRTTDGVIFDPWDTLAVHILYITRDIELNAVRHV